MKIYIAVIGKIGAGKETVFQTIRNIGEVGMTYTTSIHHFHDPLHEVLDTLLLPKDRFHVQSLSTVLRTNFGEELLGNILYHRALADNADIVFLDGVRRPQDVIMLRKLSHNFMLFIAAPAQVRWERVRGRAERPGDSEKSWKQFQKEDSAEAESMIEEIGKQADYVIDNSGTVEDLQRQVQKFLTEKVGLVL